MYQVGDFVIIAPNVAIYSYRDSWFDPVIIALRGTITVDLQSHSRRGFTGEPIGAYQHVPLVLTVAQLADGEHVWVTRPTDGARFNVWSRYLVAAPDV